jgi:hypothetical protein
MRSEVMGRDEHEIGARDYKSTSPTLQISVEAPEKIYMNPCF